MKITLLSVTSIDGFTTRGSDSDIYKWTSPEDQDFFFGKLKNAKLIFMGAKTYEAAKHLMKHKKGKTRVIFTRNPAKYSKYAIPKVLEFVSEDPRKIIKKYEKSGIRKALLVGGCEINSLFLKRGLIDEMFITIEPVIFGKGRRIFENTSETVFHLKSVNVINKSGTLLLYYISS